jgi:leucine dehydrogenase
MSVFTHPEFDSHEELVFCRDAASGLSAIIAIHNSSRGPALGGCRMWPYASEEEALSDVLRLSRGMTYKSALAGLPYGGGKSVVIGDPRRDKSPALFEALGGFVESLGGRYTVAEDVGISVPDVETMAKRTRHVAGVTAGGSGDPSPATAYGVFCGLQASVEERLGRKDLEGLKVAVQGLGHVGFDLCRLLHEAGAELYVSDLDWERLSRAEEAFGAKLLQLEELMTAEVEVYAPCALGATLNEKSIPALKAKVVAGSANNQLARPEDGLALKKRGILYAPDYVINAGGVININYERRPGQDRPHDKAAAFAHIAGIGETLKEIYALAESQGIATSEAADRLAEQRFTPASAKKAA